MRPESWFAESGMSVVGYCVELNLEELDLAGAFQVLDLGDVRVSIHVRRAGFGRVTGRFRFSQGESFNLFVAGESRPLGVTGRHPFWSADRNAWVSVLDLRIGERLLVEGGTRVVEKVEVRGEEAVFNIEVEGEHCYRVGEHGVLVHNQSVKPCALTCGDVNEFAIVNYKPKHPPCELHHGILDVWASVHVSGYLSRGSTTPTITLTPLHHNATRSVFALWVVAHSGKPFGGRIDWPNLSARDIILLSEALFIAASVPVQSRQQYYIRFNQMYGTSYAIRCDLKDNCRDSVLCPNGTMRSSHS